MISRRTRSRAARRRSSCSARWGSACPRSWSRTCAPRWRSRPPASTATRRARCASPGSPAPTARRRRRSSRGRCSRAPACIAGCSGRSSPSSAASSTRRAHDARGLRPPAHVPRDARRGRRRVRDGDLLARAGAQTRRPAARRGGRLHQPQPGPPRLPPDDGGLLPGQAAAVRLAADVGADRQRRRPVRAPPDRGVRRHDHVRDRRRGGLPRGRRLAGRLDFMAVTPDGSFAARVPLPGRFNVSNALARLGGGARAGRAGGRARGVSGGPPRPRPAASSRSRRASPSTSSSTTRTSRVRWSRCCWPRANWPPGG